MADNPVWNGQGYDPWLPYRLRAQAEFAQSERKIYADFYARLTAWLEEVLSAIFSGGRIDPHAVYETVPEWNASMREFADSTILDVMSEPYDAMFGDDFEIDTRPYVIEYLNQVENRMSRTPDEVFDLIATEVARGAEEGDSIPEVAESIDELLSATDTPRWKNRAVVVARTETIGALNAGRNDTFDIVAENLAPTGAEFETVWLATADERTRETHRAADGQRVPVGGRFQVGFASLAFPGDPSGPAGEVIQCRCTTLLMKVGENEDLSRQSFDIET